MSKLTAGSTPARAAAGSRMTTTSPKPQAPAGAKDATGIQGASAPPVHAPASGASGGVAGNLVDPPISLSSTSQPHSGELQIQEIVATRETRTGSQDESAAARYVQEGPTQLHTPITPQIGASMQIPLQIGEHTVACYSRRRSPVLSDHSKGSLRAWFGRHDRGSSWHLHHC